MSVCVINVISCVNNGYMILDDHFESNYDYLGVT